MEGEFCNKSCVRDPLMEFEANNNKSSLQESNTSSFKTLFNGANTILGNGVLIVPYALASGGWLSLVLLITISAASTYTSLLVKRCMEADSRIKSYTHIGDHAFGNIGRVIVSIVLYADLYMVTTGFLILEGDNLHNLFPNISLKALGIAIDGKSSFVIIVALVLLPIVLLDSLSILAYISATGVFASLLILISVLWVGLFDGIGFGHYVEEASLLNWKGIPTAISLYMLCYSAHPVLPALYISMQKKHDFSKVLLMCFAFATFVYVSMAVLGYLMFGSTVESQITLNLPTNKLSSQIAIYTTLITPLAKYALILKPVVIATEGWFSTEYKKSKGFKLTIRTILVATQVLIALSLPFFGYLMSLTGALLCATASLTIPCLCYLKISSTNSSLGLAERIFIWAIVCLSMVILISGTYTSLLDILVEITH
ncbi:hypothetical protein BVRB_9g222370 [Beta vulgaris subsp. vulgaris]|nr:hypothetical protein BVRB_9g222370 [Beta vulgaris subsp. vulgaris]